MITAPTARSFGTALRQKLKALGLPNKVHVKTICFSGFGYGSAVSAEIDCAVPMGEAHKAELRTIQEQFCATSGGPQFSGTKPSSFKVRFVGMAYPCG